MRSLQGFTSENTLITFLLQIQLLLQYLKNDPRKAVKRLAIQDLKFLANKTPHTWSRENMQVCKSLTFFIIKFLYVGYF